MATIKNCLIVGGTSGIGEALAIQLSAKYPSSRIIIAGRNRTKGESICSAANNKNITFESLDAVRIKNVKAFCHASAFVDSREKVDVLIMTQGIFTTQGRTIIDPTENLDQKMSLHYYSRMSLVKELLETDKLSQDAIIVSVLDGLRSDANTTSIDYTDPGLDRPGSYTLSRCATYSTTFTDIMFDHFALRPENRKRSFIHAYPGYVDTNLADKSPHMPFGTTTLTKLAGKLFATSAEKCAKALLDGPGDGKGGMLFNNRIGGGEGQGDKVNRRYNLDSNGKILVKTPIKSEENGKIVVEHTLEVLNRC